MREPNPFGRRSDQYATTTITIIQTSETSMLQEWAGR